MSREVQIYLTLFQEIIYTCTYTYIVKVYTSLHQRCHWIGLNILRINRRCMV